jgi:hypothetical protein
MVVLRRYVAETEYRERRRAPALDSSAFVRHIGAAQRALVAIGVSHVLRCLMHAVK